MAPSSILKFSDIKKGGKIGKRIVAKIGEVRTSGSSKTGVEYSRTLLKKGRSEIVVVAFGNDVAQMKKYKKGSIVDFPPGTFKGVKKDKNYPNKTNAVLYDLHILSLPDSSSSKAKTAISNSNGPSTSTAASQSQPKKRVICKSGLKKVIGEKGVGKSVELADVELSEGRVYRYWGCVNCTVAIPKAGKGGKYYCHGQCRRKKNSRAGVPTQRKPCMVLRNLKISDDCGHEVKGVVVFTAECSKLLGKNPEDFETDNQAENIKEELFTSGLFKLVIERKRAKRNSKFPGALTARNIVKTANKCVIHTEEADVNEFTTDGDAEEDVVATFSGLKRMTKFPKLGRLTVKIEYTEPKKKHGPRHTYKVDSALVFLVNNKNFPTHPDEKGRIRLGSEVDVEYMTNLFLQCGYKIFRNNCIEDIQDREELENHIRDYKHEAKNYDAAIVVMMSHGGNGEICLTGADQLKNKANVMEDIVLPFCDSKFPEFQGKPKVFIFEGCQDFATSQYTRSLKMQDGGISDVIMYFAALPGFSAHRSHSDGSLFIHFLTQVIMKHGYKTEFRDLLRQIEQAIRKYVKAKNLKSISTPYNIGVAFAKFFLIPKKRQISGIDDGNESAMDTED